MRLDEIQETHQEMRYANVNYGRHRTRTTKYNRLVHKFRHRGCVGTQVYQKSRWNDAICNGHYAVQGHSRSPILVPIESSYGSYPTYWLILTITSYITLFPSYGWLLVKFSLARAECLTLTLSRGDPPANIVINDISLKTRFFGLHFPCRKY